MNAPQAKKTCSRCAGCGYVANTVHGEPWKDWLEAPPSIAALTKIGVVKPVVCTHCSGTGEKR